MSNVSKAILIGRVGQEPENRQFPSGGGVTKISLATTEKWKGKDGSKQEETTWHTIKFYGGLADVVQKYVNKGDLLYVEGSIKTETWDKNDGSKGYATVIKARDMQMLGGGQKPAQPQQGFDGDSFDNEIPF